MDNKMNRQPCLLTTLALSVSVLYYSSGYCAPTKVPPEGYYLGVFLANCCNDIETRKVVFNKLSKNTKNVLWISETFDGESNKKVCNKVFVNFGKDSRPLAGPFATIEEIKQFKQNILRDLKLESDDNEPGGEFSVPGVYIRADSNGNELEYGNVKMEKNNVFHMEKDYECMAPSLSPGTSQPQLLSSTPKTELSPLFASMENGCQASSTFKSFLEGLRKKQIDVDDQLKSAFRNVTEKKEGSLETGGKYSKFSVALDGSYHGIPVGTFEHWYGDNNGIYGWGLTVNASMKVVKKSLNDKNIKFRVVSGSGVSIASTGRDKTSLNCDISN
jgi:hypothetical protein